MSNSSICGWVYSESCADMNHVKRSGTRKMKYTRALNYDTLVLFLHVFFLFSFSFQKCQIWNKQLAHWTDRGGGGWHANEKSCHLNGTWSEREQSWIHWDQWIHRHHLCPLSGCTPEDRHNPLLGVNMHIVVQSFVVPLLMSSPGFFCFLLISTKTWCILKLFGKTALCSYFFNW